MAKKDGWGAMAGKLKPNRVISRLNKARKGAERQQMHAAAQRGQMAEPPARGQPVHLLGP